MGEESGLPIASFLFGNVDKEGRLEENFLDKEAVEQLSNLETVLSHAGSSLSLSDEPSPSTSSAVDNWESHSTEQREESVDYFEMEEAVSDVGDTDSDEREFTDSEHEDEEDEQSLEENPLSRMLPSEYRNADARKYFPEFRKGKVLRFSRLFGPGRKPNSLPQIWRGVRGNKKKGKEKEAEEEGEVEGRREEFSLDIPPTPPPEDCETDDEMYLLRPEDSTDSRGNDGKDAEKKNESSDIVKAWRFGPAQMWYDLMGVPDTGEGLDYGIKLKKDPEERAVCEFPPEAYLPVNFTHWEDEIIWDGEEVREEVQKKFQSGKQPICGWIPTQHTRTYESFMAALKSGEFSQMFSKNGPPSSSKSFASYTSMKEKEPNAHSSIFPMDNQELRFTRWEDDIIWDTENMDRIPPPKILTMDLYDSPTLFGLPEDKPRDHIGDIPDGVGGSPSKQMARKEKIPKMDSHWKKSQVILGQVQRRKLEEEEEMESMPQTTEKDPFNLSNDEYYLPKGTSRQVGVGGAGNMIQHSIPAQNILRPFFPTHLNAYRLRHFYRQPMKRPRGPLSKPLLYPLHSLQRHIAQKEKQREEQRQAMGGGDVFFMREPEDLSGKDGEIVLFEFSEEHPPIMQQPGMACKIRNYYKRKAGKEGEPSFEYGETSFTHTSPFLGTLSPGESVQAIENTLYKAPIYKHNLPTTDFLVIRTRQGYFLRTVKTLFSVGQLCPVYEVPSPNSKRATHFVRDFLLAFIYRLFWASSDSPRRLRMEDVRNAFPHYAESSVRKRLKQCADYKRLGPGTDSNFWVLRNDFRLPSKEEVKDMVSPEMCCAHYSMLVAEQRLKDAGYGEKYFFTPEDEDEGDADQVTMEAEVKCAPWNTTRAFLSAMKGKCLLDQTGIADPTGCGEGFSYVRVSAKPPKIKEDTPVHPKRLVTGTDADLRKLPLKDAREMLRNVGVKEEEIKSLSRWEIIDVIRTLSTQQAKLNSDFSGMGKFARGNIRFNLAEMQERYRQDCQRIFHLQNKTLASEEPLSTDDESSAEDSDMEEMEKDIQSMLMSGEKEEEREREELQKILRGETLSDDKTAKGKKKEEETPSDAPVTRGGRKLRISRTYRTKEGQEYTKTEEIRRDQLIEAYMKIRTTKDDAFIRAFAQMDEQYKEEQRREKRRLQDRLRRIRRNEQKAKMGLPLGKGIQRQKPEAERKPPPPPKPYLLKMRCSACNGIGHMKTNKNCPLYGKNSANKKPSLQVALTDEQIEEEMEVPTGELISVDGTKVKFNKALVEHAEKMKKKALKLRFPKSIVPHAQAQHLPPSSSTQGDSYSSSENDSPPKTPIQKLKLNIPMIKKQAAAARKQGANAEWLQDARSKQSVQRRRADPRVTFSVMLEGIVSEMRELPGAVHFLEPVNAKKVQDYYKIINKPMDLRRLKANVASNTYETRESFLNDSRLMMDNSRLYNGDHSEITQAARELFALASRKIAEKEHKLMKLEKAINPLLDDNDIVAFSFILANIVQSCKNLKKSYAFHQPVDGKKFKTYYDKIKHPMDMGTIELKLKKHAYTTVESFIKDFEQIVHNSTLFNGPQSLYTKKADEIREIAAGMVKEEEGQLMEYERNIQKALEAAETESVLTGPSSVAGDGDGEVGVVEEEDTIPYAYFAPDPVEEQQLEEAGEGEEREENPPEEEEGELIEDSEDGEAMDFGGLERELVRTDEGEESLDVSYDPLSEFMDSYEQNPAGREADMNRSGRLMADLAMSDSEDEDDYDETKRPRLDQDTEFDIL